SEDRAEELGEVAEVARVSAVLHSEAASGRACRWGLGVSLPVRSERIVAAALLGVGKNLVGLADLLEAVGRVLGLRDVRVILPREPAIGGLDRLVVRFPVDPENLVVVLEIDCHCVALHGVYQIILVLHANWLLDSFPRKDAKILKTLRATDRCRGRHPRPTRKAT